MSLDWPHAPVYQLDSGGIYMVTAATLHKNHLFANAAMLTLLERSLLSLACHYHWQLEAWAVFSDQSILGRADESALLKAATGRRTPKHPFTFAFS